jgi:hypothetical protein
MSCRRCLLGVVLIMACLSTGCGGDKKDVNKDKDKPVPAAK